MIIRTATVSDAAEITGRLLGYQSLEYYEGLPKTLGIIAAFSKVGGTKRGVGTALFSATHAIAPKLGFTEIDATIRADNTGGLAYYSKMGFVDHSMGKSMQLADGTSVERISKRLILSSETNLIEAKHSSETPRQR